MFCVVLNFSLLYSLIFPIKQHIKKNFTIEKSFFMFFAHLIRFLHYLCSKIPTIDYFIANMNRHEKITQSFKGRTGLLIIITAAMATDLDDIDKTLGHDIDIEGSYQIMKDVSLSLGFSYMVGTESMEKLKRADNDNRLKWGWFSLNVSPRIFTTKW